MPSMTKLSTGDDLVAGPALFPVSGVSPDPRDAALWQPPGNQLLADQETERVRFQRMERLWGLRTQGQRQSHQSLGAHGATPTTEVQARSGVLPIGSLRTEHMAVPCLPTEGCTLKLPAPRPSG